MPLGGTTREENADSPPGRGSGVGCPEPGDTPGRLAPAAPLPGGLSGPKTKPLK